MDDVTLAELRERVGDGGVALVDVRTPPEYDGSAPSHCDPRHGHIPGARNVPLETLVSCRSAEEVRELVGLPVPSELIAYCHVGTRSAFAVQLLRDVGYEARNYAGSWHEWSRDLTLPVEQ